MLAKKLVLALALIATIPAPAEVPQLSIKGSVAVAPELAKKVTPTSVLFIIARQGSSAGGPPAAVVRVPGPKFPVSFELGPQNLMMGGQFKGPYELTAKLSMRGDVMTAPGDLLGEAEPKKPHSAGDKDVKLVLNKESK